MKGYLGLQAADMAMIAIPGMTIIFQNLRKLLAASIHTIINATHDGIMLWTFIFKLLKFPGPQPRNKNTNALIRVSS
ncbi:hypothetical protein ACTXT7_002431 [Hymenolepis weldensis]